MKCFGSSENPRSSFLMDILNRRGVALKNMEGPNSHVLSLFQLFPHFYSPLGAKFANFFDRPIDLPNKNTEQKYRDMGFLQCEAPKIAKLVYNLPITMVYGTSNYSYWAYKPTYNWGASHCRRISRISHSLWRVFPSLIQCLDFSVPLPGATSSGGQIFIHWIIDSDYLCWIICQYWCWIIFWIYNLSFLVVIVGKFWTCNCIIAGQSLDIYNPRGEFQNINESGDMNLEQLDGIISTKMG